MDNQNYPNNQQPPQYQQSYQPNYGYQQQPQSQRPVKPDNYLVWAILCTILCCLPFGIVSIVYAAKVDGLYSQGDYQAAQEASEKAKKWAMWGAIIGVAATIIVCVIYGIFFAYAVSQGY